MARYPWSVLGLLEPTDERGVRSAYAKRLKIVRPEGDAEAFQALVAARNLALDLARSRADEAGDEADGDAAEEFERDAISVMVEAATLEALLRPTTPSNPFAPTTIETVLVSAKVATSLAQAPVTVDLDGSSLPPDRPSAPLGSGPLITVNLDTGPTPPVATPPVAVFPATAQVPGLFTFDLDATGLTEPSIATSVPLPTAPVATPAPPAPVLPPVQPQPSLPPATIADVLADIRGLLTTGFKPIELTPAAAQRVLAALAHFDRPQRIAIEPDILRIIAPVLPALSDALSPKTVWWHRLGWHRSERASALAHAVNRRDLVLALDEDFGWTTSDRRVFQVLGTQQAGQTATYLRAMAQARRYEHNEPPPRRDSNGMPIIDPRDLRSYFGDEYSHYAALYQASLRAGRWLPAWSWRWFFLAPLWILATSQRRMMVAWPAALLAMFMVNDYLTLNIVAKPAWWALWLQHLPLDVLSVLVFGVSIVPVLAVHAYIAAFGHKIQIEQLSRKAARADRRGLFDPSKRQAALKRGKKPSTSSGGSGFQWWYIWVALVALRILASAFK